MRRPGYSLIGSSSNWIFSLLINSRICCCSTTKSCPTLCNPIYDSTPGFPVLHYPPVCSNSCPSSQWCHPTTSSSVVPFSFRLQSFPTSESFQMSHLFTSGGQSTGASASASFLGFVLYLGKISGHHHNLEKQNSWLVSWKEFRSRHRIWTKNLYAVNETK